MTSSIDSVSGSLRFTLLRLALLSCLLASAAAQSGTVTYVYTDAQGTPVMEADAQGNVTATFDYTPYGAQALGTPPAGPGYSGHVNDPETGLVYMQARYYDPDRGGFLSVDPVTPLASNLFNFNRYSYANGNPYRYTDPDGRSTCANPECTMSTIDSHPAVAKGYSPSVNGNAGLPQNNVGRGIASANSPGLTITFVNDDSRGVSPNQPVTTATAKMVESAVINSGVQSVNINSTTGGRHAPTSNHARGRAVDINQVNGQRVDNSANRTAVIDVQNAFRNEPGVRENFGPAFAEKTLTPGVAPVPWPRVSEDHQSHIHESGQQ